MAADPIDADVAVGRGWTGCYAGVNVGYVRGDDDATDSPFTQGPFAGSGASWNTPPGAAYETIGSDGSSAIGGVELGCDYQVPAGGLNLVFGGAVDFSLLNVNGEGTSALSSDTHTSFDTDWAGTLRARIGLASPDVLFYATGGLAVADIGVRAFDLSTAPTPGHMDVSGGHRTGWGRRRRRMELARLGRVGRVSALRIRSITDTGPRVSARRFPELRHESFAPPRRPEGRM